MSERPTVRVCQHCGELASEAAKQAEPICPENPRGLVGPHSYVDRPYGFLEALCGQPHPLSHPGGHEVRALDGGVL